MVVSTGLEPVLQGFSVLCSTNWAMRPWHRQQELNPYQWFWRPLFYLWTMSAFGAPKETRTLTLESIGSLNRRVYLFHHRSKILGELIGSTSPNYQLNLSLVLCLGFEPRIVKGVLPTSYTAFNGCRRRIWTSDLRVMSPTSYQTATILLCFYKIAKTFRQLHSN